MTISEQRKKALVDFIIDKKLNHEYATSHYKTAYMFVRYNHLSEFRNWLKDKPYKELFIKE